MVHVFSSSLASATALTRRRSSRPLSCNCLKTCQNYGTGGGTQRRCRSAARLHLSHHGRRPQRWASRMHEGDRQGGVDLDVQGRARLEHRRATAVHWHMHGQPCQRRASCVCLRTLASVITN